MSLATFCCYFLQCTHSVIASCALNFSQCFIFVSYSAVRSRITIAQHFHLIQCISCPIYGRGKKTAQHNSQLKSEWPRRRRSFLTSRLFSARLPNPKWSYETFFLFLCGSEGENGTTEWEAHIIGLKSVVNRGARSMWGKMSVYKLKEFWPFYSLKQFS